MAERLVEGPGVGGPGESVGFCQDRPLVPGASTVGLAFLSQEPLRACEEPGACRGACRHRLSSRDRSLRCSLENPEPGGRGNRPSGKETLRCRLSWGRRLGHRDRVTAESLSLG